MKRSTHVVLQLLGITLQFVPQIWPLLPHGSEQIWATFVASIQGAIGLYAHGYNPNGTPAAVAQLPGEK